MPQAPVPTTGQIITRTTTSLKVTVVLTLPIAPTPHAVMTPFTFATALPVVPQAAWLADYHGGDCAEAIWIIRNLTQTGFELWGLNCCNRALSCNFTVNLVVVM